MGGGGLDIDFDQPQRTVHLLQLRSLHEPIHGRRHPRGIVRVYRNHEDVPARVSADGAGTRNGSGSIVRFDDARAEELTLASIRRT